MACHDSLRRFGASCFVAVLFLWLCAAFVCSAREQRPLRELEEQLMVVRSYGPYASFDRSDSATLQVLKDASINGGALQLTPDTRNNDAYLVNKSGSVLLKQPFTIWRALPDEDEVPGAGTGTGTGRAPQPQARRVRVVSFNSTFSMNVYYDIDKAVPGEGLAFVIAPSLDKPPPGSHGGFLSLTNATLQAAGPSKNRFVAIEFDTFNQSYDPSDNHVGLDIGSVVSNVTANLADFNITIATKGKTSACWILQDHISRSLSHKLIGRWMLP